MYIPGYFPLFNHTWLCIHRSETSVFDKARVSDVVHQVCRGKRSVHWTQCPAAGGGTAAPGRRSSPPSGSLSLIPLHRPQPLNPSASQVAGAVGKVGTEANDVNKDDDNNKIPRAFRLWGKPCKSSFLTRPPEQYPNWIRNLWRRLPMNRYGGLRATAATIRKFLLVPWLGASSAGDPATLLSAYSDALPRTTRAALSHSGSTAALHMLSSASLGAQCIMVLKVHSHRRDCQVLTSTYLNKRSLFAVAWMMRPKC